MKPAPRVLVVDDEESIRTFVERVLHLAGYETAVAADGAEALRIAEAQVPFDLLLADVVMPDMHGDELARRLLRLEPDLKVLYFTGYSDQLFAETTTLGANEAFIDKPATTKGLVEAVSLMLSGHTHRLGREILADLARLRSFRVATTALPVRIGETIGRLVNVSATGALVQLPHGLPSDREWPMRIEAHPEPVELRVRVVRSHAVSVSLPEAMWQHQEYAVALAFTELEPRTEEALKKLCADAFDKYE
jgi:two-component system, cell cycle response regulator CpdR